MREDIIISKAVSYTHLYFVHNPYRKDRKNIKAAKSDLKELHKVAKKSVKKNKKSRIKNEAKEAKLVAKQAKRETKAAIKEQKRPVSYTHLDVSKRQVLWYLPWSHHSASAL